MNCGTNGGEEEGSGTASGEEADAAGSNWTRRSFRGLIAFFVFQSAAGLSIAGGVFILSGMAAILGFAHAGKVRGGRGGPDHGHRANRGNRANIHRRFPLPLLIGWVDL